MIIILIILEVTFHDVDIVAQVFSVTKKSSKHKHKRFIFRNELRAEPHPDPLIHEITSRSDHCLIGRTQLPYKGDTIGTL